MNVKSQNELRSGVKISETAVNPHSCTDSRCCIKPYPYFYMNEKKSYGIDLRQSFVIGDHPHEVELATNIGARGISVLTGHGVKHREEIPGDIRVVSRIEKAVQINFQQGSIEEVDR